MKKFLNCYNVNRNLSDKYCRVSGNMLRIGGEQDENRCFQQNK